jgi:alpha-galactosidase
MRSGLLLVLIFGCLCFASALKNGLGLTPQMGWNSWNVYGCDVNENKIKQAIDAMTVYGLRKYGYEYVNIDDCWSMGRDENGVLIPDNVTFPSGIAHLADYAHARGLKFGIYSDSGFLTCAGRPGSYGYEDIDAKTWASWGVDYLKYDNCYTNSSIPGIRPRYERMRDALAKVDRPIFYSMCEWGKEAPWLWGSEVGNSWRTTSDISDEYSRFIQILDMSVGVSRFAGPGGWNDMDMLEVGNGGMTLAAYQVHFAFWCLLKSPLILGLDMHSNMTPDILSLITNTELLAISQDKLGVQGDLIWQLGPSQIWAAPLADGGRAFIIFERKFENFITLDFPLVGYDNSTTVVIRDILNKANVGTFTGKFSTTVTPDGPGWGDFGFFVGRMTPVKPNPKYLTWRPWLKNC